jgi:hypothetical protein
MASSFFAPSAAAAAPTQTSVAARAEISGFLDQVFTFYLRSEPPHTSELSWKRELSVKMPINKPTDPGCAGPCASRRPSQLEIETTELTGDIHDFVDVDHRNRLEFDAFGKRPDVSIPPSVSDDLKQ